MYYVCTSIQPISFDVPTIDVALKAVADNDVKLLLGFQRRFDSNFRTIREKVGWRGVGVVFLVLDRRVRVTLGLAPLAKG